MYLPSVEAEDLAVKLYFGLLKGLPYMLGYSSSAGKLLEHSTQHIGGGLFLLGKEIAIYSHDGKAFLLSLIAQTVDN